MFEQIDALWDTLVQGWWVQVLWVVVAAFWALHSFLRGVHFVVTWPSDRLWKGVWVAVSVICTAFFLLQIKFGDQPTRVSVGALFRNLTAVLLVVTLIIDALRGIRGTAARRVIRARQPQQEDV